MNKFNNECELIQDLLPLYQDGICSEVSKSLVEKHLETCSECKKTEENLMNYVIDEKLVQEKHNILEIHEKKERKKSIITGIATASILMIPVIICLVCNIIVGHALDWFFIVLTSLMLVASITVVPLVVQQRKGAKTIISFTLSLLLLLMTCNIYSHGSWFMVAAVACIFGLSILFAPYVVYNISLPEIVKKRKGLLVMCWDTLWLYALIIVTGIFVGGDNAYWQLGISVTFYSLLLPWGIFIIIRYIRCNVLAKTGLIIIVIGMFFAFINDVVAAMSGISIGGSIGYADLKKGFSTMNYEVLNANIQILILLVSICIGVMFIFTGIIKSKNNFWNDKK